MNRIKILQSQANSVLEKLTIKLWNIFHPRKGKHSIFYCQFLGNLIKTNI